MRTSLETFGGGCYHQQRCRSLCFDRQPATPTPLTNPPICSLPLNESTLEIILHYTGEICRILVKGQHRRVFIRMMENGPYLFAPERQYEEINSIWAIFFAHIDGRGPSQISMRMLPIHPQQLVYVRGRSAVIVSPWAPSQNNTDEATTTPICMHQG